MISKKMEEELNKQINEEFYSSYLYLSMEAYFEARNLKGFANWMHVQYLEETEHGMKIYDYINERGGTVKLKAIAEPPKTWKSPLDAFEETLKHEKHITERINHLVEVAEKEKDRATFNFLQWYIDEQVEEEGNDEEIIANLKLIGKDGRGLLMLDRELAQRTYTPPAASQE